MDKVGHPNLVKLIDHGSEVLVLEQAEEHPYFPKHTEVKYMAIELAQKDTL